MKIVFQADPINTLNIKTDSSLCLAKEAILRKFDVWFFTPNNLTYKQEKLITKAIKISEITETQILHSKEKEIPLDDTDILLIRQNPPFNIEYITYTYLLELLKNTTIVNNPNGIRNFTEKLSILMFPELIPETLVTSNEEEASIFLKKYKSIVCKPLYEFGGNDITKFDSENENYFQKNFRALYKKHKTPLMVQRFIPEVKNGDKRVILVNGKPVATLNRIPKENSIKSNLAAGGQAVKTTLTERDLHISETVGKELVKRDIIFAGIDIIDKYLTEINVTSPNGITALNNLYNLSQKAKIEAIIWDSILEQHRKRTI